MIDEVENGVHEICEIIQNNTDETFDSEGVSLVSNNMNKVRDILTDYFSKPQNS